MGGKLGLATKIARNPLRWPRFYHYIAGRLNKKYYKHLNTHSGDQFIDTDWDNLIILDGCRYDLFESVCDLSGDLQSRVSPGSESYEFMESEFEEESFHDTIYITANPHIEKLPPDIFFKRKQLLDSHWDDELETVPPDAVCDVGSKLHEKYPQKRLTLHFMQPHFPFIGPSGREISHGGLQDRDDLHVWTKLQFGLDGVSKADVWDAYRENLQIVLESINEELLPNLGGKTVITSDHGNLLADWIGPIPCRGYGHPSNIHHKKLLTVPWFEVPYEARREIMSEEPKDVETIESETVQDRLESLGYR